MDRLKRHKPHCRVVILFGGSIPSVNTLRPTYTEVLPKLDSKFIENMYEYRRKDQHTLLLQMVHCTTELEPDITVFREIMLQLQQRMRECLESDESHSFSAIYFHNFTHGEPSVAAQCEVGALRTICERLNISTFWIAPVMSQYQKWVDGQMLKTDPDFHAATDFNAWNRCLPPSNCKSLFDLLVIDAKASHHKWEAPGEELTATVCDYLLCDYPRRLIAEERRKRKEMQEGLQNAQSRMQHEIEATRQAKQELDDANLRYNSLLRQVNIGDNSEESGVVQRFQALNRLIDELSIDIGQQVPENLLKQFPNTTSCHGKIESQGNLSSTRYGQLLLVLSRAGASMDIEEFLGLLFGSIICQHLHSGVFQPFYPPGGAGVESGTISKIYTQLRKRAPQMQSAKWRIDTFTALLDIDTEKHSRPKSMAARCEGKIATAFQGLFGKEHQLVVGSKLETIFNNAWELNCYVKSKVAHLGDFETEYFSYDQEYVDSHMQVLDAKRGDPTPRRILLTCGLGLRVTKAVGENKDPTSKVVEKAMVVSPLVYKRSPGGGGIGSH